MKYKIAAVALLVVFVFPAVSSAQTVGDLEAQIQALLAQIQTLQAQLNQQTQTTAWCHTFSTNLQVGSTGSDVDALRIALEKEGLSPDNGSNVNRTFDEAVASVVTGFQEKYAADILTPFSLQHGTGYVGRATRTKLNALYGCNTPVVMPPPTPIQTIAITSLSPSSGPAGGTVTINGSGFASTGNSIFVGTPGGGSIAVLHDVQSPDGKSITFTFPTMVEQRCEAMTGPQCGIMVPVTGGQVYPVSVDVPLNNGQFHVTDSLPFTVTGSTLPPQGSLTVSLGASAQSYITPGQTGNLIGNYRLTAGSEAVNLTSLNVSVSSGYFQNIKVFVAGYQFGVTVGVPNKNGSDQYSALSPTTIPAGTSVTAQVFGDALTSATGTVPSATGISGCTANGMTTFATLACNAVSGPGVTFTNPQ